MTRLNDREKLDKVAALDKAILSVSQDVSTKLIVDRAREFEHYLNYNEQAEEKTQE